MRSTVFMVLSLVAASSSRGQMTEAARLFDTGNEYYRDGDFEKARSTYEGALQLGFESAPLYHNLGNSYFRLDNLGLAMLYYQRAARMHPGDPEIEHNVRLVQRRSRDRFSQVPIPVLSKWWNTIMDALGIRVAFWLGAFAWVVGLSLACFRIWSGTRTRVVDRAAKSLALVGLLLCTSALTTSLSRSAVDRGVVVVDRAQIREEPSGSARSTVAVHEALVVDVLTETEDWVRIRLPNGVVGFVRSEAVRRV